MTLTIPERRAAVARLTSDDPDLSARAIAKRLDVHKDTVLRDLHALREAARATNAPPPRRPRLRRRTRRTTTRRPTTPTPPAPAPAHATTTIPHDEWVRRALTWCARAGHPDPVDAIRWALGEAAARIHAERTTTHTTPMGD